MTLIACRECTKEISDQAASCPHCSCPVKDAGGLSHDGAMKCPTCDLNLIPIAKPNAYSFAGLIGFLVILVGLVALLINPLAGLIAIACGALIDKLFRGSKIIMTCPHCRHEAPDTTSISYQIGQLFGKLVK